MTMWLQKLLFLLFLIICSLISSIKCQDNSTSCFDEFDIEDGEGTVVSFVESEDDPYLLLLVVNVNETVEVDSVLYSITWLNTTTVSSNDSDPYNTALEYVAYDAHDLDLSVVVTNSMSGIVDYNNTDREDSLQLTLYFAFQSIPDSLCMIEIQHDIQDENTEKPHYPLDLYWVYIREDFPLDLTIPDTPMAFDFDKTSPNNVFTVETSPEDCPMQAEEESYTCTEGEPVPVTFVLTRQLDWDTMEPPYQINCSILLTDNGTRPMKSTTLITILVTEWADEDPVFTSDFYTGYLAGSFAGTPVEVDPTIEAVDGDLPLPPSTITYTMKPEDSTVGADKYFSMNSSTAEVTLIQDIGGDFLSNEIVNFVLTACDEQIQCSNSFLSINLPLQVPPYTESLDFEQLTYTSQVATPENGYVVLRIHAQSTVNQDIVQYFFVDDGSDGLMYFSIDEKSGEISTISVGIPPGYYELTAEATDGNMTDETLVNIQVVVEVTDMVFVDSSYVRIPVPENTSPFSIHTVTGTGAFYFCILEIRPSYFSDYFEIDSEGTVSLIRKLDADNKLNGNLVTIKAGAYVENYSECTPTTTSSHVLSNEVLIEVEITDENDNLPYFVDPTGKQVTEVLFAYPQEITLQRAIGPVARVMGRDDDIDQNITYKLWPYGSNSMDAFAIDYSSGEIYLVGELRPTKFLVEAQDSPHTNSLLVHIEILGENYISTMNFDNLNQSEVEGKIYEVSAKAEVPVYLLYSNLIDADPNDDYWKIEAQVYCTNDLKLVDTQTLKELMDDSDVVTEVEEFTDRDIFDPWEENSNGYKAATIALGCIFGLLLIISCAIVYKMWYKKKIGRKGGKKINTLGKAYANEEFRDDNNEPSFATIFGNNPVEGTVLSDERKPSTTTSKRNSSGSQEPSSPKLETAGTSGTAETSAEVHQKEHKSTSSDASEKLTWKKY